MGASRRGRLRSNSSSNGRRGRALTTGNYVLEVRGRLLAAQAARGARLRSGPGAPRAWRDVGPTLTERGEARALARLIDSTRLLVPDPF